MSTKIYNGYRFAPGTDLLDLIPLLRARLDPVRDALDAALLAERAVRAIDAADLCGEKRPDRPVVAALATYLDEQAKATPGSIGHDPHRFELAAARDAITKRLHALVYSERRDLVEAFEALEAVEEYGYWNNADEPAGISEAEWGERRDSWARVLPWDVAPSQVMWSWTLRPNPDAGMHEIARGANPETVHPLVLRQIPDRRWRLRQMIATARLDTLAAVAGAESVMAHVWDSGRIDGAIIDRGQSLLADLGAPDLVGATSITAPADDALRRLVDNDVEAWVAARLPR